jgi:hypothetical protein
LWVDAVEECIGALGRNGAGSRPASRGREIVPFEGGFKDEVECTIRRIMKAKLNLN